MLEQPTRVENKYGKQSPQLPSGIITVKGSHTLAQGAEDSHRTLETRTHKSLPKLVRVREVEYSVVERENIGLAGLKVALSRLGGGNRRRKVKIKVMEWWQKMVFPFRRAWCVFSARVKTRKNGGGLLKLHDDIQTCGYEDVQIMWEMLRTETEHMSRHDKRKSRWFWRSFPWSNHGGVSSLMNNAQ